MSCKTIETVKQFDDLLMEGGLLLVDYKADWCLPCQKIAPIFQRLANENQKIAFVVVDVDKSAELSTREGIDSMPTFVAYKDGKSIGSLVGANEEGIKGLIKKLLNAV